MSQGNKESKVRFRKIIMLPFAAFLMMPLSSFSQNVTKEGTEGKTPERVELSYKQRHSRIVQENNKLYADGIKIKRDLSILKEIQEQRILSEDEIPSDELYGGIWVNNHVNAYSSITNAPDTFKVDLSNFTMPTMGYTTSVFGKRNRRFHYGMDLKVQTGDTIYAAFDGKVRMTQFEKRGYGNYVVIRHTNGLETVYGHLSKFLVNPDDVVKSGTPIALGGNTGRSSGSHLHFEIRYMGKPMDPRNIVDFENKVCHKDSYLITPQSFNTPGSRYTTYTAKASSAATPTAKPAAKTSDNVNKYKSGDFAFHRIQTGDTLGRLAQKYGTSISKICQANGITSRSTLRVGRSLKIPN